MHFSFAIAAITLASIVFAETINVLVGLNNTLTFTPENVTANAGDVVAFTFLSQNHSVTQSTFAEPCIHMVTPSVGVDSGFQAVPDGANVFPEYSFTILDDQTPFWFFCAQVPNHCQEGMVFAINPTPDKNFTAFKATAMGVPISASESNSTTSPNATDNGGQILIRPSAYLLATLGFITWLII